MVQQGMVQQNAPRSHHVWALVLAAGEGRRLSALTMTSGGVVPKQYCSLWGGGSLLQDALRRAQSVVPRQHVCTVVAEHHRQWWSVPLWSLPARNTVVQHADRGTGVGLLLPLLHIMQRDPKAQILVLPSDHHVCEEPVLAQAMREALDCARVRGDRVILMGMEPDETSSELGYIVPGQRRPFGATDVVEFVEKPPLAEARRLVDRGALWNTFIVAASAEALVALYERRYGALVGALRRAVASDAEQPGVGHAASRVYEKIPAADFSRDILCGQEAKLRVLPVPSCGWSDLGCPAAVERVVRRERGSPQAQAGPWSAPAPVLSRQLSGGRNSTAASIASQERTLAGPD